MPISIVGSRLAALSGNAGRRDDKPTGLVGL
jgi:hypothetical protein